MEREGECEKERSGLWETTERLVKGRDPRRNTEEKELYQTNYIKNIQGVSITAFLKKVSVLILINYGEYGWGCNTQFTPLICNFHS